MTEEQRGSATEQLFKYAVERINRDPELLSNTTLIYDIHYVDREDSWHASKKGNDGSDYSKHVVQSIVWYVFCIRSTPPITGQSFLRIAKTSVRTLSMTTPTKLFNHGARDTGAFKVDFHCSKIISIEWCYSIETRQSY